jgi:hypothetical protein
MGTLDDNSLFAILRFLEAEELNSFAMCSRHCREARSSPSLDQTRTGTIICLPRSDTHILGICDAISRGRWNNEMYSGNRTRLKIVGLGRVVNEYTSLDDIRRRALSNDVQLTGVTSLDLSCTSYPTFATYNFFSFLARILLNLRELDVSDVNSMGRNIILSFCEYCSDLTRITGNGSRYCLCIDGCEVHGTAARIAEIYVDSARFITWPTQKQRLEQEPTDGSQSLYMFMHCKDLERLSIKNAIISCGEVEQPLSQKMIIKFVRHTLTLRWLRSDLTEENVAMLQQERPDITFVTNSGALY